MCVLQIGGENKSIIFLSFGKMTELWLEYTRERGMKYADYLGHKRVYKLGVLWQGYPKNVRELGKGINARQQTTEHNKQKN